MATLLQRGKDSLANGAVLGGVLGVAIVWGDKILGWIEGIIPETWTWFGDYTIPIIIIGVGIIAGYIIDRY